MGSTIKRAWNGFTGSVGSFTSNVMTNLQGLMILGLTTIGIASILAMWGVAEVVGLAVGAVGSYALAW